MKYPSLANIAATPDQDLGLTIAWKLAKNQAQTVATSAEAYFVERVTQLLADYGAHHVTTVVDDRIKAVLSGPNRAAIIAAAKVSDAVDVPPDVMKP